MQKDRGAKGNSSRNRMEGGPGGRGVAQGESNLKRQLATDGP